MEEYCWALQHTLLLMRICLANRAFRPVSNIYIHITRLAPNRLYHCSRSSSPFWWNRPSAPKRQVSSGSDPNRVIGAAYSHTDILKLDSLYDIFSGPDIQQLIMTAGHYQETRGLVHLQQVDRQKHEPLHFSCHKPISRLHRGVITTDSSRTQARVGVRPLQVMKKKMMGWVSMQKKTSSVFQVLSAPDDLRSQTLQGNQAHNFWTQ